MIAAKSLFVQGCTDSQLVTEKDQGRERGEADGVMVVI